MSQADCPMPLNPDISGVGVRVALYIQIALSYAMSWCLREEMPQNTLLMLFSSGSLIVAALIQIKEGNISLLDALIIYWLSLAPLYTALLQTQTMGERDKELKSENDITLRYCLTRFASMILSFFYIIIWCVWNSKVFLDPIHFGEDPMAGCSPNKDLVLVFMGIRQPLSKIAFKPLFLVLFVCLGVITFFATLFDLYRIYPHLRIAWDKHFRRNARNHSRTDRLIPKETYHQDPEGSRLRKFKLSWGSAVFAALAVAIILVIVMIEGTIASNNVKNDSSTWSYGQVTALSGAILQTITGLCQLILKFKSGTNQEKSDPRSPASRMQQV